MKIIINACYGGYGLSDEAKKMYIERKGLVLYRYETTSGYVRYLTVPVEVYKEELEREEEISKNDPKNFQGHKSNRLCWDDPQRDDPVLVQIVEELGQRASVKHSNLKVFEIPDDVQWTLKEYDGFEHIAEKHRTWG